MQIFNHGEKQTLEQILASRDRRMKIQQRLVHDSEKTVVTAKLNIPGSIKNNDLLMEFFLTQVTAFEQQLQVKGICYQVVQEDLTAKTGPERFYLIEASVFHVKQIDLTDMSFLIEREKKSKTTNAVSHNLLTLLSRYKPV